MNLVHKTQHVWSLYRKFIIFYRKLFLYLLGLGYLRVEKKNFSASLIYISQVISEIDCLFLCLKTTCSSLSVNFCSLLWFTFLFHCC